MFAAGIAAGGGFFPVADDPLQLTGESLVGSTVPHSERDVVLFTPRFSPEWRRGEIAQQEPLGLRSSQIVMIASPASASRRVRIFSSAVNRLLFMFRVPF